MSSPLPPRMPIALRLWTMTLLISLWLSGVLWIVLHYAFPQASAFGPGPNPWEAPTIRLHGLVAVASVFLLGWITARHVVDAWSANRRFASGLSLFIACAILVVSGYALYYVSTESIRISIALLHEVLGAGGVVFALAHWLKRATRVNGVAKSRCAEATKKIKPAT